MKTPLQVLIVEDSEDDARLLVRELTRGGYDVADERVETADAMAKLLSRGEWDLVLSDHSLPHFNGVAALGILKESALDIPFIFVSGTIGEEIAVSAMKAGAHDYVMKGNLTRLVPAVARELQEAKRRREARQAAEALHARDEEFRALAEHAPDAICRFDREGRLIYANPAYEQLLGLPTARFIGRTLQEVFPKQPGIDDHQRKIQQVIAAASALEFETVLGDFASQHHPSLNVRLVPERDRSGQVVSVLCIGRDISALKTTERQLRTLVENSPDIIMRYDRELRYRFVNRGIEKITGIPAADYLGRVIGEPSAVHGQPVLAEQMRQLAPGLDQVFTSGNSFETEIRLSVPAGDLVFNIRLVPEEDETGQITSVLAVAREITARQRAETALRASEERFRQVTENIDEVFWLTDPAKTEMIYVSPAYQRVWGRSCESLYAAPQSWLDEVHPEDRNRVREAQKLQPSGTYDLDYRIVRPDGATRWIHERAFPVKDAEGKSYRIAGVASDITARRQLEEQFRQAQKMEVVGQLAGGIAHDFNNLLTIVQIQSSLLLTDPEMCRAGVEGVQEIMDAARRAANLTRQLLTFSRRQIQACRNLDLGEVIGDLTKMLRRVLGEDISLQNRLAPALPQIYADPSMMEQVILNLVVNARDAMPNGGRLTVSVDVSTIDERHVAAHPSAKAGRFVCLKVSDTGCGIAPEIRSRIFEPFFTTKEVGKGTGLGLATVFGIVEEHHGWIEVESEVGSGTTFQVFLPALEGSGVRAAAAAGAPDVRRGNETILLVEDETTVRTIAATALRQLGYRVLEAGTAVDAIKRWDESQGKVDLLVTDVILPGGLSGKELADRLRERLPSLKVIFATGYSTGIVGRQLQLEPGENYLEKPYSFCDLVAIVGHRLDQGHQKTHGPKAR